MKFMHSHFHSLVHVSQYIQYYMYVEIVYAGIYNSWIWSTLFHSPYLGICRSFGYNVMQSANFDKSELWPEMCLTKAGLVKREASHDEIAQWVRLNVRFGLLYGDLPTACKNVFPRIDKIYLLGMRMGVMFHLVQCSHVHVLLVDWVIGLIFDNKVWSISAAANFSLYWCLYVTTLIRYLLRLNCL